MAVDVGHAPDGVRRARHGHPARPLGELFADRVGAGARASRSRVANRTSAPRQHPRPDVGVVVQARADHLVARRDHAFARSASSAPSSTARTPPPRRRAAPPPPRARRPSPRRSPAPRRTRRRGWRPARSASSRPSRRWRRRPSATRRARRAAPSSSIPGKRSRFTAARSRLEDLAVALVGELRRAPSSARQPAHLVDLVVGLERRRRRRPPSASSARPSARPLLSL